MFSQLYSWLKILSSTPPLQGKGSSPVWVIVIGITLVLGSRNDRQ